MTESRLSFFRGSPGSTPSRVDYTSSSVIAPPNNFTFIVPPISQGPAPLLFSFLTLGFGTPMLLLSLKLHAQQLLQCHLQQPHGLLNLHQTIGKSSI